MWCGDLPATAACLYDLPQRNRNPGGETAGTQVRRTGSRPGGFF